MRKLKMKNLQLQDSISSPIHTEDISSGIGKKKYLSMTSKVHDPLRAQFRSSCMGHQVTLSQALADEEAEPSHKLQACMETLQEMGNDTGSYSEVQNA